MVSALSPGCYGLVSAEGHGFRELGLRFLTFVAVAKPLNTQRSNRAARFRLERTRGLAILRLQALSFGAVLQTLNPEGSRGLSLWMVRAQGLEVKKKTAPKHVRFGTGRGIGFSGFRVWEVLCLQGCDPARYPALRCLRT